MSKTKAIEDFCDKISEQISGMKRSTALEFGVCVFCKEPVYGFNDILSEKEYKISGMCQVCQDEVFK